MSVTRVRVTYGCDHLTHSQVQASSATGGLGTRQWQYLGRVLEGLLTG